MRHLALALLTIVGSASGLLADSVVHPTGRFPADLEAVQAAVDQGGRVLLKAVNAAGQPTAFDFGPTDQATGASVTLTTDVAIRGESIGSRRTVIRGGFFPFQEYEPARVAIQRIVFEGPGGGAAFLGGSAGAELTDNVITKVAGFPWAFGGRKGTGFWIGGGCCDVTGSILIARNTISDIDAEDGIGLALVAFDAEIRVVGNDIRGTGFMGILAFANAGRVTIEDNVVVPGPSLFPGSFYDVGNGIQAGPPNEVPDAGSAVIRNNRVLCENPNADGIVVSGFGSGMDHSLVTNNRVEMRGSLYGGITLAQQVSSTVVSLNRVTGDGAYALDSIGFDADARLERNLFLANATGRFESSLADVYLDQATSETWVLPCQGTVIDLGTGNHTPGCTPALPDQGRPDSRGAHARDIAQRLSHERARLDPREDGRLVPVPAP